jgi:hypothetical protein
VYLAVGEEIANSQIRRLAMAQSGRALWPQSAALVGLSKAAALKIEEVRSLELHFSFYQAATRPLRQPKADKVRDKA